MHLEGEKIPEPTFFKINWLLARMVFLSKATGPEKTVGKASPSVATDGESILGWFTPKTLKTGSLSRLIWGSALRDGATTC